MNRGRFLPSLCMAASIFFGACSEDNLSGQSAKLTVSPYPDASSYAAAANADDGVLTINLGDIPVYASRKATFQLSNTTAQAVTIASINYTTNLVGSEWLEPLLVKGEPDEPLGVPAASTRLLEIAYAPQEEGAASAEIEIKSNAGNAPTLLLRVVANGKYEGAPDIEVVYNDISSDTSPVGPAAINCETNLTDGIDNQNDGVVDGCRMPNTLDIGQVGLGRQSSARFYIRNAAGCAPYPGSPACGTCALVIDRDTSRQNIGLGFKAGTNPQGYFSFQGSTATPATIPQLDETCTTSNVVPLVVLFDAPTTSGSFSTTVVIESNDPDEPLIEIPITAEAVNAPIAIANLRAEDPNDSSAPFTEADDIGPLDRVYIDGRAKGSTDSTHDPEDPADTTLIGSYSWEVIEYPPDADPNDFDIQQDGAGFFSVLIPAAGFYVVQLTVTNTNGQSSLDTEGSKVEFSAVPQQGLHLQLTWDHPSNDQDMHLTNVVQDDRVCSEPYDVFYSNKRPIWNSAFQEAEGANPVLDRDDTNGIGPENINIDEPDPGTYRVYVHYFGNWGSSGQSATENTLKIYIDGIERAQFKRTLDDTGAVWAVADILWLTDGTAQINPYPTDNGVDIGAIEYMQSCSPPTGWSFP